MGAAWALHRAGARVSVFELAPEIGGNAKTHAWQVGDERIVTGLSVLAWPASYFHNYRALLRELDIATEPTRPLRYFVRDGDTVYAHGTRHDGNARYAGDLARWERLVAFARRLNRVFSSSGEPSLYGASPANPLSVLPLRTLARSFGISQAFWERVFVPIHSSSFLSVDLDALPATIAPSIEDIVSLAEGGLLETWSGSSRDVFARMSQGFEDRIHVKHDVRLVTREKGRVLLEDTRGTHPFDAVVFACNARSALDMIDRPTRLERALLGGIAYPDTTDPMFLRGEVHSDASVLPDAHRAAILDDFANYVEIREDAGRLRYANTFVLSSWVPTARGKGRPMFVSYDREEPAEGVERVVTNQRAHPVLSTANLARAFLLRTIQGKHRTWFAGSYATPGNGHDLSLLSGFVVARALGAPYPFEGNAAARADLDRLSRFMLGR